MSNFKNGDLVRLKSGSPTMTVIGESTPAGATTKMVRCAYFDHATDRRAGSMQEVSVLAEALEAHTKPH